MYFNCTRYHSNQRDSYLCRLTANHSTSLNHLTLLKLVNTKGEICPWPWYASCPSSMYSSEIQSELQKTQHYYVSHLCQGTHSVMCEPTQIECDSLVLMKQPPFLHVCSSTQLHWISSEMFLTCTVNAHSKVSEVRKLLSRKQNCSNDHCIAHRTTQESIS
jgi:hypothetical protein